jgi:hypothetical protein
MWRLVKIFGSKTRLKIKLGDNYMLGGVGLFVLAQTALLLTFQFVQKPTYVLARRNLPGTSIEYFNQTCSFAGPNISLAAMVLNVLLVCYVVYLAIIGRKIPSDYNDGQLIGVGHLVHSDHYIYYSISSHCGSTCKRFY